MIAGSFEWAGSDWLDQRTGGRTGDNDKRCRFHDRLEKVVGSCARYGGESVSHQDMATVKLT